MKLQASPAAEPRAGRRETIVEQRGEIERVIEDLPSLRQIVGRAIAREIGAAQRQVGAALAEHGETPRVDMERIGYSEAEVLGDWFPDDA